MAPYRSPSGKQKPSSGVKHCSLCKVNNSMFMVEKITNSKTT